TPRRCASSPRRCCRGRAAALQPVGPMILFGFLCGVDALIAAAVLVFFFWGLADGSVSAFNIHLWLAMLAGVAAVLGGGIVLRARGQRRHANVVLAVLAAPGLLLGLMLLLVLVLQPDFR